MNELNNMVNFMATYQERFNVIFYLVVVLFGLAVVQAFLLMWCIAQNSEMRDKLIKMEGYYVGRNVERNRIDDSGSA